MKNEKITVEKLWPNQKGLVIEILILKKYLNHKNKKRDRKIIYSDHKKCLVKSWILILKSGLLILINKVAQNPSFYPEHFLTYFKDKGLDFLALRQKPLKTPLIKDTMETFIKIVDYQFCTSKVATRLPHNHHNISLIS